MKLLQFFRCIMGKHKRNRHLAVHDGSDFRSVCIGCGKPMFRSLSGWRLTRAEPQSDASP